ncbi:MAG TPA: DUF222 domain-containing protein, partial [Candidatus Dormibacteraeota bacterium]|nr:DUF222 domain-containing protein [Candidatus Dormibacteraeota bacterium]
MVALSVPSPPPLSEAVDGLASESVDNLSDHALGSDLVDIRREIDRLEAEFLRRLERFDRKHGALSEGAVSTVSWLRSTCGVTAAAAAQRVSMARVLADLPMAMESLRRGRSSFTNISMIARLADDVGVESARTVEHTLVTAAEQLDPGRMRLLTMVTRHRLDADGVLDEDNRNHDRRWVACDQTYGGIFVLRGELDAEGGAVVKTALDALSSPSGPDDVRTGCQRRADALVDIASRQLQTGGTDIHGQRPHLTLTAGIDILQRQPGAEPAQVGGIGPVHVETARRIACDSVRTLVVVARAASPMAPVGLAAGRTTAAADDARGRTTSADQVIARATVADQVTAEARPAGTRPVSVMQGGDAPATRPLSVGRATRTIPPHIRTALALRDKGCRFPGCDRPPEWTDGHHIEHWADGGPTEIGNLVSLCRRHHRVVHERGW